MRPPDLVVAQAHSRASTWAYRAWCCALFGAALLVFLWPIGAACLWAAERIA